MGFPSPAADYLSRRLTVDMFCGISMNSRILETSEGYAVIDVSLNARQGDTLAVLADGEVQFVKLAGRALISEDGEAIEGSALEEVEVIGRVTFFINRALGDDGCPVL
ncbi:TPA: LexA family protein [Citrobacter farmeri]